MAARHKADIIKDHLPGFTSHAVGFDHRMYCKVKTEEEASKQEKFEEKFLSSGNIEDVMKTEILEDKTEYESEYEDSDCEASVGSEGDAEDILSELSPCDVRVLMTSEEELTQTETFERDTDHHRA